MTTIQNNHDYTNNILYVLKQRKAASLSLLKDSIPKLRRDSKGEENLQACLDDLVSSGKIFASPATSEGKPVFLYHLDPRRNHSDSSTNSVSVINADIVNDGIVEADAGHCDNDGDTKDDSRNVTSEQATSENAAIPQQQRTKPEYIIDPEFKSLLGAKTPEQYEALKETIRSEKRFRDPFVVWDEANILSDGHNRHQIYEELQEELGDEFHIEPPKIIRMSFANRDDAMMWVLENQLDRRNLKTFQQIEVALKLKDFYTAKAKANQRAGVSLNLGKGINSNEEVAKRADVSHDTVRKVERILEKMGKKEVAEAIKALRRGDTGVSIDSVYQQYCGTKKSSSTDGTNGKKKSAPPFPAPTEVLGDEPLFNPPKQEDEAALRQNSPIPKVSPKVSSPGAVSPFDKAKEGLELSPGLEHEVNETLHSLTTIAKRHSKQNDDLTYIRNMVEAWLERGYC